MSPALWGSAQTNSPSSTFQPGRTSSRLKLCQPEKSLPLKRRIHPAACSAGVSVLISDAGSPVPLAEPGVPELAESPAISSCSAAFHSSFRSESDLPVASFHISSWYLPSRQAALIRVSRFVLWL